MILIELTFQMKSWGQKEFWGLGEEYDPDWVLTEAQKELRNKLMEVCRTKIRPQAVSRLALYRRFPFTPLIEFVGLYSLPMERSRWWRALFSCLLVIPGELLFKSCYLPKKPGHICNIKLSPNLFNVICRDVSCICREISCSSCNKNICLTN